MSDAWACAVITIAIAAVMTAATWRPRPRQAVLLLVGPVSSVAAAVDAVSGGLGLMGLLPVPYAYLLVAAARSWERPWARWAVPATVMPGCLALAAPAPRGPTTLLVLAIPFTSAAVSLGGMRSNRCPDAAAPEAVGRAEDVGRVDAVDADGAVGAGERVVLESSRSERVPAPVVVTVAVLQGCGGLGLVGVAVWAFVLERRHPDTGPWAGAGDVIAVVLAVLGLALAAGFFALAVALRRRYRDVRRIFVVVQVVGVALLVGNGWHLWTWPGIAWGLVTGAVALVRPRRGATAPPGVAVD